MMRNEYCYLDNVRIDHGINKCKAVFIEVYNYDRQSAISLLNDPRITFPCLYVFSQMIDVLQIENFLSLQNISALKIIKRVLNRHIFNYGDRGAVLASAETGEEYPVFKWMFDTGHAEDGLDDGYEEIMDSTVSVLIDTYKDNSILPVVADMIFKRNRKGHYTHDLIWAFFRSNSPDAIKLMAERICSSDIKDVNLACHLLNLDKSSYSGLNVDERQKQYQDYLRWLDQNASFLSFTGESFQYSSNPILYKVNKAGWEGAE